MLDEWGDAELAELRHVQDLMLDFSLTDDGELAFQGFGVLNRFGGCDQAPYCKPPLGPNYCAR
jgi:hypothetical protein